MFKSKTRPGTSVVVKKAPERALDPTLAAYRVRCRSRNTDSGSAWSRLRAAKGPRPSIAFGIASERIVDEKQHALDDRGSATIPIIMVSASVATTDSGSWRATPERAFCTQKSRSTERSDVTGAWPLRMLESLELGKTVETTSARHALSISTERRPMSAIRTGRQQTPRTVLIRRNSVRHVAITSTDPVAPLPDLS